MEGSQNSKRRSPDPFTTLFGLIIIFFSLVTLVVNMHTKFEVSSSNRSGDMEGSQNFKTKSRDTFPSPLT